MHGQFLWFSARIGSEISFQKFLFNFACYCIEYSTCRYFFVENFLHARQKRKYLYTIPDKFSPTINILFHWFYPLIEKDKKEKKKKKEEAIYSSSKSGERKSKTYYSIYDHEVHLFSSTTPLPSFETRTISLPPCFRAFYFIPRLPPPPLSPPENRFSGHSLP